MSKPGSTPSTSLSLEPIVQLVWQVASRFSEEGCGNAKVVHRRVVPQAKARWVCIPDPEGANCVTGTTVRVAGTNVRVQVPSDYKNIIGSALGLELIDRPVKRICFGLVCGSSRDRWCVG